MSDTEDVYMCEDDEDYGLVSIICFNLKLCEVYYFIFLVLNCFQNIQCLLENHINNHLFKKRQMSTEFLLYVSVDIFYIITRVFSITHIQLAVNSHLKVLGFDIGIGQLVLFF